LENNKVNNYTTQNHLLVANDFFLLKYSKPTTKFCNFNSNLSIMKKSFYILTIILASFFSCKTSNTTIAKSDKAIATQNDTVRIANDELEYEVIIIDIGFSTWLASRAFPRGYHSQSYLENKNRLWINEWNNRVLQPFRYNPNLYEMTIAYDPNIDYGYEVNYLIYNYLVYFQNTYKQKLFGYVPAR
jgi:hypothetical protein